MKILERTAVPKQHTKEPEFHSGTNQGQRELATISTSELMLTLSTIVLVKTQPN